MQSSMKLRKWQENALAITKDGWRTPMFKALWAVCPGGGKTYGAARAAEYALRQKDVEYIIVIAPTVNIKKQWKTTFHGVQMAAFDDADNEALRWRVQEGRPDILEGRTVLCITYGQLVADSELFCEIARRKRVLVIADEVHHADEAERTGEAVSNLAEHAYRRLALSGTPFNTKGGSLAMCETRVEQDEEGRDVRVAVPTISYTYRDAIEDKVCRSAEFIKVLGKSEATMRDLTNEVTYNRIIDLARQRRNDSLRSLLLPSGDFFHKMATEALGALEQIKSSCDPRAGMLVVARDMNHGNQIVRELHQLLQQNPAWSQYQIAEFYNDTPDVHNEIQLLPTNNIDIVVTVRMISEGVDVKRLKVGLYATDYRTRMFFTQFIGRFVRWESHLDEYQQAKVIIPAHVELLEYAREIEEMINSARIPEEGHEGGETGTPDELLSLTTEANQDGLIYRGQEENDRTLANRFFEKYPSLRRVLPETLACQAAREGNLGGSPIPEVPVRRDWRQLNQRLVVQIVRRMDLNGANDQEAYAKVQNAANRMVGIPRLDAMTPDETLIRRHQFLSDWLRAMKEYQISFDEAVQGAN